MSWLWVVCRVEGSVAWDAHIVCRSDGCSMLLWTRAVRSRLWCGYGILLFDQTLNPGYHQCLTMQHIILIPRFLRLSETDQSTPALVKRISAKVV